MSSVEIKKVENEIGNLILKLNALRKANSPKEVPNYQFETVDGSVSLLELFGSKDQLLMIHNMGQGCRYCTLWADGFNGFVPHIESIMSLVLVSKDSPAVQRKFANSRGWWFRLASHGGGTYIQEQSVSSEHENMPGVVLYERREDTIFRKNESVFGPGDIFCSMWSLLGLAGLDDKDWTPQYNYWQRPKKLDDGGSNVID